MKKEKRGRPRNEWDVVRMQVPVELVSEFRLRIKEWKNDFNDKKRVSTSSSPTDD